MSARDDVIFKAQIDLSTLQNLFECVNQHAGAMLNEGDDADTEHYALTLEAIAEKGIRVADDAMERLGKLEEADAMAARVQPQDVAEVAEDSETGSKVH